MSDQYVRFMQQLNHIQNIFAVLTSKNAVFMLQDNDICRRRVYIGGSLYIILALILSDIEYHLAAIVVTTAVVRYGYNFNFISLSGKAGAKIGRKSGYPALFRRISADI